MNNKSELYISRKTMPGVDCFIEEADQTQNGSLSKTYEFVEYRDIKSKRRRFLGFDCDPLPGEITRPSRKSSRFMTIAVSEAMAKEVLKGEGSSPKPKCESREVKRKKKREQRKKLRWRWCWNLNRIVKSRREYYEQCKNKNKKKCTEENKNDPRVCVCAILKKMVSKKDAKRAKRKCLVEKLTRWVKKKNIEPNEPKILQTAKELLPAYDRIARRMRQLQKRSQKKKKQSRGRKRQPTDKEQKPGNVEETQRKQTSPHNSSQHQQSTQQQNQHKKQQTEEERREEQQENSRLHQEKEHDQEAQGQNNEGRPPHKIRHQGRHRRGRVNPVLKLYGYELYKNSTEPVLSTEFSQALASLSRRRKDRRKRRRKARRTASSSPG